MERLDNNEEFIHAIFAQMCSSRTIEERLKNDFNLPLNNLQRTKMLLVEDLKPIIIEEEINNCSLKKKHKIKHNRSQKKRSKK